jgi:hypothetical protein
LQDKLGQSTADFNEELEQSTPLPVAPPQAEAQSCSINETVKLASEVEPAAKSKKGEKPKKSLAAVTTVDQITSSRMQPDSVPDNQMENEPRPM